MDQLTRTAAARHAHPSTAGGRRLLGSPSPGPSPLALLGLLALPALLLLACGVKATPTGHVVSGTVTGEVQAGVTITLSGGAGAPITTTTGASGGYAFESLDNGSYLATAAMEGYTFKPGAGQQAVVSNADVPSLDFIATATHHAVRGTISGVVSAGVTLTLTGPTTATTTSAADGTFAFEGMVDSTYVLTPTLAGHGFSPGARPLTLSGANAVGQDFVSSLNLTPLHAISGTVAGATAAGVTISLDRGTSPAASQVTSAAGAYTFPALADGDYLVTPTRTGFTFVPHSLPVTLGGADVALAPFQASASAAAPQLAELSTGGRMGYGIAIGNDLNAWITDGATPVVSRVLLQASADGPLGQVTDFPLGAGDTAATAIALRFFGLRCYTEPQANRIGCMGWGGVDEFSVGIPTPASNPVDVVNGPGLDQLNPDMWFAEHDAGKVGRLRLATGSNPTSGAIVAEYVLPAGCKPTALAWSSGNVWWAAEGCRRIGWIDPASGVVQVVNTDVGQPISMAPHLKEAGVWFVDGASDRLGRLTAAGGLNWFSPAAGSRLTSVTNGPDDAVYVTQFSANSIARLPISAFDPNAGPNTGRITQEFPLATAGSQPFRIAAGADGNVWFTERGKASIGVVTMATHCLGGKVTLADLSTPVPGVALTLVPAGGSSGSATTTAEGNYGFCGLAPGVYTVTPALAAKTFTPASLSVTMGGSALIGRSFVAH
jgi:streptogramin lyase